MIKRASNAQSIPDIGSGLSIVKQCVDLDCDKIAVRSAVDVSTITVSLPVSSTARSE